MSDSLRSSAQLSEKILDWRNTKLTPLEDSDLDLLYTWHRLPAVVAKGEC